MKNAKETTINLSRKALALLLCVMMIATTISSSNLAEVLALDNNPTSTSSEEVSSTSSEESSTPAVDEPTENSEGEESSSTAVDEPTENSEGEVSGPTPAALTAQETPAAEETTEAAEAAPQDTDVGPFTINNGPITIENGSAAGTFKVSQNGSTVQDKISTTDTITIIGNGQTSNTIIVNASNAKSDTPVNITLGQDGQPVKIKAGSSAAMDIQGTSNVNLTLVDNNTLTGDKAGLQVQEIDRDTIATVTIKGNGTLNANGGTYGAGIGGSLNTSSGTITIESGTINAKSNNGAAGIGGGYGRYGDGGTIKIEGGTVNASGNYGGAGIGGGGNGGDSGTITISGGKVSAIGSDGGAGIGGGNKGDSSNITISGDAVITNAKGEGGGAGIGGGCGSSESGGGNSYKITISGKAKIENAQDGSDGGAGIGGGYGAQDNGTLTITDTPTIRAYSSKAYNAVNANLTNDSKTDYLAHSLNKAVKAETVLTPTFFNDDGVEDKTDDLPFVLPKGTQSYFGTMKNKAAGTEKNHYTLAYDDGEKIYDKDNETMYIKTMDINATSQEQPPQYINVQLGEPSEPLPSLNINIDDGNVLVYWNTYKGGCWEVIYNDGSGEKTANLEAKAPLTITGPDKITNTISIMGDEDTKTTYDELNVILSGVNIAPTSAAPMLITDTANVNLTLSGENTLDATDARDKAGLEVDTGSTVTIKSDEAGTGKLTATGYGAGIGGAGGNIIIESGIINAESAKSGSGIGGDGGDIIIKNGTIIAKGSGSSAGIGGGNLSNSGNITIKGGTIIAEGGRSGGAGIGSGNGGNVDTINISGGEVSAKGGGGSDVLGVGGAGIGGGYDDTMGTINISGDAVITNAEGTDGGAGIGSGNKCPNTQGITDTGSITIDTIGTVKATGSAYTDNKNEVYGSAGIGGGVGFNNGTINITSGTIEATAGTATYGGAGIGGGSSCNDIHNKKLSGDGGAINISGDNTVVSAIGNSSGTAGIGGGYDADNNGTLTIADKPNIRAYSFEAGNAINASIAEGNTVNYIAHNPNDSVKGVTTLTPTFTDANGSNTDDAIFKLPEGTKSYFATMKNAANGRDSYYTLDNSGNPKKYIYTTGVEQRSHLLTKTATGEITQNYENVELKEQTKPKDEITTADISKGNVTVKWNENTKGITTGPCWTVTYNDGSDTKTEYLKAGGNLTIKGETDQYTISVNGAGSDNNILNVTLNGVNIAPTSAAPMAITDSANVKLTLETGTTNTLDASKTDGKAGLAVSSGNTVTITGTGTLNATGGAGGAGIGGGNGKDGGNINITDSAKVTANGSTAVQV